MKKMSMVRGLVAVSSLSLALTIAGCSGGTDEGATPPPAETSTGTSTQPSASGQPSTSSSPTESTSSDSTGGSAEQTEVKIGQKFTDPETDDVVEIVSVIRNFPSEEQADVIADGGEVVLVQVKVTPGEQYGGAISEGAFKISWDGGSEYWSNKTRMVTEDLEDADLEEFDRIARRDGGSKSGWIAFIVEEKTDSYHLEYTRDAAKVIGSDKTIDEFVEEIEIPSV